VLEVSFGTGYLLSQYAHRVDAHGAELNRRMISIARRNVARSSAHATLVRANVEGLPYRDVCFDSIVSTMAFSGYPDAHRALGEITRVLRPGGRLVLIDVGHPRDRGHLGSAMVALWRACGDLIRDMPPLFRAHGLDHTDEEIGGWGSVHLYVATKPTAAESPSGGEQRGKPDPPERARESTARPEGLLREEPGA
jgi:SAM-dependent methyltransferase